MVLHKTLAKESKLPHLKSILVNSTYGNLSTISREPYGGAPMQWTSIATGKTYKKHGITEYYKPPGLNSHMRNTKAIWNILSKNDLKCGVVGWWATWPAEKINGFMASSYVKLRSRRPNITTTKNKKLQLTYTGTIYDNPNLNQTYPPSFHNEIKKIIKQKENTSNKEIEKHFRNLSRSSDRMFYDNKWNYRQTFYDIKWNYISNEIFSDIGKTIVEQI